MKVGVPREIKNQEYRVGLTPDGVRRLVENGHRVIVEKDAASRIGFTDTDYKTAGATIVKTAEAVFTEADLIVKVKEPQASECLLLNQQHVLFTFLHLAPNPQLTDALLQSGCTAIAYETVSDEAGHLPLLAPMSEIAGRMAVQAGAHCLELRQGGRGVLLSGASGVVPATVLILGGGIVGTNAARIAVAMGADVTVVDKSPERLKQLDKQFNGSVRIALSNHGVIDTLLRNADLVIGAAMAPGATAPKLISAAMLQHMQPGSVIVDVAIDQGGCCETSTPTTHDKPTYVVDNIIHYCVSNIPGAVARTATQALSNVTLPYVMQLAEKGYRQALLDDRHLRDGLNIHRGRLTCEAVAQSQSKPFTPPLSLLAD